MTDPGARVFCPTCFKSYPPGTERCAEDGTELMGLPQETSLEGTVLDGKYTVGPLLGRGGMGTVYRATQKLIDREVALKILRADFTSDMNAVKRFFREAKAVARLRSPHAVILYDFGLAREGHLYYTMELVKGRPLSREANDAGPFPLKRACRIMLHVARALEEAHGLGIVHRDLKPSNIMLVGSGDDEVAKVLDFGIAKIVTAPEGSTLLTDVGIAVGTPRYMSPEQATGGQVDYRSDLYSLGVIFYELLAGLHPFEGGTPSVMMRQHVHEQPIPVRIMAPEVEIPIPVERFMNRLLEKRPSERPRGAAEVTSELAALLEGSYDSRTTRMPRLSTSPTGLRQIVEDESDMDDSRWAYVDSSGLQDTRVGSSTDQFGRSTDELAQDAAEESRGTEDYTEGSEDSAEGTEDYTEDGADGGDATPFYQKQLKPVGRTEEKEDWLDEEFIPMDGKDEWTTTSRHIPRIAQEDTEPPEVEWDAPEPEWEREPPPPVWAGPETGAVTRSPRSSLLTAALMVTLAIVVLFSAALHYQLLDGLADRFSPKSEPAAEASRPATAAPEPAPRPSPVPRLIATQPSSTPAPEPSSAPKSEPGRANVTSSPAGADASDRPADAPRADEIRRRGVRAAAAGDYEAAIALFKRSRELGGDPADLGRLIDECRKKVAEQFK